MDKRGIDRMLHVVRQVYHLNDHDPETFRLMLDLERVAAGEPPVEGELVRRYGALMRRLDEK